jgi:hypothetical protein
MVNAFSSIPQPTFPLPSLNKPTVPPGPASATNEAPMVAAVPSVAPTPMATDVVPPAPRGAAPVLRETPQFGASSGSNGGGGASKSGGGKIQLFGKSISLSYLLGGLFFFLLSIGLGTGFYLSQQSQDTRQQAAGGSCPPYAPKTCPGVSGCYEQSQACPAAETPRTDATSGCAIGEKTCPGETTCRKLSYTCGATNPSASTGCSIGEKTCPGETTCRHLDYVCPANQRDSGSVTSGGSGGSGGGAGTGGTSAAAAGSGTSGSSGGSGGGSSAAAAPSKASCGGSCSTASDCAVTSGGAGFQPICSAGKCVNPLCPTYTTAGSICSCGAAPTGIACGELCGGQNDGKVYPTNCLNGVCGNNANGGTSGNRCLPYPTAPTGYKVAGGICKNDPNPGVFCINKADNTPVLDEAGIKAACALVAGPVTGVCNSPCNDTTALCGTGLTCTDIGAGDKRCRNSQTPTSATCETPAASASPTPTPNTNTTSTSTTTTTVDTARTTVPAGNPPVSGSTETTIALIMAGAFFVVGGKLIYDRQQQSL